MEVIYYYDKKLEKCPVKEYFKKYLNNFKLNPDIYEKYQ